MCSLLFPPQALTWNSHQTHRTIPPLNSRSRHHTKARTSHFWLLDWCLLRWRVEERKKETATDNINNAKSRTGYVIMFAEYPLIWSSKLQTEIALSSTEAEYIALSTAMREIIHLIDFLREAKTRASQSTSIMQLYTAKSLKITLEPLKWLKYLKCALAQNIWILSIITFVSTFNPAFYRYTPSKLKIKSTISSQNLSMRSYSKLIANKLMDGKSNISKRGSVGFHPFMFCCYFTCYATIYSTLCITQLMSYLTLCYAHVPHTYDRYRTACVVYLISLRSTT